MIGQEFGRLTVVGTLAWNSGQTRCVCRCACGNGFIGFAGNIKRGLTRSCGCLNRELARARELRHGHAPGKGDTATRTYHVWQKMRQRCGNENDPDWLNYGFRGIKVCDHWQDFGHFLADMGECPPGLTIDRYPDNNGSYEPGNCRWATRKQQWETRRPHKASEKWWLS